MADNAGKSEAERKAAAERAKKRLKQRQAKKNKKTDNAPVESEADSAADGDAPETPASEPNPPAEQAPPEVQVAPQESPASAEPETSEPHASAADLFASDSANKHAKKNSFFDQPAAAAAVSEHKEQLDKLQADLKTSQDTIALLVSEKSSTSNSLNTLQTQYDELEAKLASSTSQHDSSLKELQDKLQEVTKQHEEESAKAKGLSQKLDAAKEASDAAQRARDVAAHETETLEGELSRARETVDKLQGELDKGNESQAEAVKEMQAKLKDKSSHADALELQLSKQRTSHSQLRSEIEDLQTQLNEAKEASTSAEGSKRTLESTHASLQAEHTELQATHKTALDEKETLAADLKKSQNQHTESQSSLASIRAELKEKTSSLTTSQEALTNAEAVLSTATNRRDALQKDNEELMADLTELRSKFVSLQQEHVEAGEHSDALNRNLRSKDSELANLRNQLEELREAKEGLEKDLQEVRAEIKSAQDKVAQVQKEADATAEGKKQSESAHAGLKEERGKLQDDLTRLRQTAADTDGTVSDLQSRLKEAEESKTAVESERDAAAQEAEQMREQVEELRREIEEARERAESAQGTQAPEVESAPQTPFAPTPDSANFAQDVQQEPLQQNGDHELLQGQLDESRTKNEQLEKKVSELHEKIFELNALVLNERDKTMKAMNEVFAVTSGSAQRPKSPSAAAVSPAASPTRRDRPPRPNSLAHRRSASHLPTLTESLEPGHPTLSDEVSPRGTTFAHPMPSSPWRTPSPTNTDLALRLQEQQKAAMPPKAKHNRRASLVHLKTRLEDELPEINLTAPSPETHQGEFAHGRSTSGVDFVQQAKIQMRTRLREEHIFCSNCDGDLLII